MTKFPDSGATLSPQAFSVPVHGSRGVAGVREHPPSERAPHSLQVTERKTLARQSQLSARVQRPRPGPRRRRACSPQPDRLLPTPVHVPRAPEPAAHLAFSGLPLPSSKTPPGTPACPLPSEGLLTAPQHGLTAPESSLTTCFHPWCCLTTVPGAWHIWVWRPVASHSPFATSLGLLGSFPGKGAGVALQDAQDPPQRWLGVPAPHEEHNVPSTPRTWAETAASADVPCGLDSPTPLLISKEGVSF